MGLFGSSKRPETFEEFLKEALGIKYKFKRGSLGIAIKNISDKLGATNSPREFDSFIRSREAEQAKDYLERDGFDDDKFDEVAMIYKRERKW